ncbi:hypothetical protein [Xanthomonas campestris]|uniref:hypothetical protein n=1 Tax=Xanthomonas campestris TaxID=339 RepID=UPI000E312A77|nr:hypothetical protein [Xanthomonas campestris]MEA9571285.1 hypothetical protein [Xanthomonas campestris]MEA9628669.1 hypothetical protein [Xanthomonas campestris]MEA9632604.1 hypothetical protein [Xanthomonas campestris]MEB1695883.1 hypothetical protein [Xanthomonas campestris pv. campestris]RFF45163.1 hypothetical protein D0A42_10120 [Xanthomonas campestris pv. campestris]
MSVNRALFFALSIALASMSGSAIAAASQSTTTVQTTNIYRANTPEASAIQKWLDSVPNADRRTMDLGKITVKSSKTSKGMVTAANDGPPTPLPATGSPGEKYTIINELPGGFIEKWTFEWVGGGGGGEWRQTDYESHAPVVNPEKPNEL